MNVLLINPTRSGSDSYINPPLHLIYIAQAVNKAGHDVQIMDVHYLLSKNHKIAKSDFENRIIEEIISREFDILGIGSIVSAYDFTKRLVNAVKLKKPAIPVIIGGGMSIALKDLWEKKTQADYLVESDGELVIQRFLEAYTSGQKLSEIPGLYVRQNSKFVCSHTPDLPKNLDYIDMPDWDLLEKFEDYMHIQRKWINLTLPPVLQLSGQDRVLPIVMTRGCPYKCTFCYHVNNFHRRHSPQYVVTYLLQLKNKYQLTHIATWDDLIMADRKWLSDLCDEIIAKKVGLKIFTSGGKPNLVTRELLKKMKEAGFMRISYGIESGSQEILDVMKKQTTVSQNYNAVKMGIEEGIFVHMNMVLGMPGETIKTLKETFSFLTSLAEKGLIRSENLSFSFATGYPGTELYEWMLKNKIVSDTEEYLKGQIGVGEYKHNLCGINAGLIRFLKNYSVAKIDFLYYLHFKNYNKAFAHFSKGVLKSLAILILPDGVKQSLRAFIRKSK